MLFVVFVSWQWCYIFILQTFYFPNSDYLRLLSNFSLKPVLLHLSERLLRSACPTDKYTEILRTRWNIRSPSSNEEFSSSPPRTAPHGYGDPETRGAVLIPPGAVSPQTTTSGVWEGTPWEELPFARSDLTVFPQHPWQPLSETGPQTFGPIQHGWAPQRLLVPGF